MTPVASASAWVLHDLGLAAGFGGSLFGKFALHPAMKEISSRQERGRVVEAAWKGFNIWNMVSLGAIAGTWLAGRTMLSGWEIDRTTRGLVLAKDALIGTAVLTGVGAFVGSMALGKSEGGDVPPLDAGGGPGIETSPKTKALNRVVDTLGYANLFAIAGVIGLTAVLAMKSSESHRFGFISKFLP